ncbi:hypothetical protein BS78_05G061100 [Paspalum vaginatum]|nr:hypothetical protein BS78_05G061100 [Paspalum vaginatum]
MKGSPSIHASRMEILPLFWRAPPSLVSRRAGAPVGCRGAAPVARGSHGRWSVRTWEGKAGAGRGASASPSPIIAARSAAAGEDQANRAHNHGVVVVPPTLRKGRLRKRIVAARAHGHAVMALVLRASSCSDTWSVVHWPVTHGYVCCLVLCFANRLVASPKRFGLWPVLK